MNAPPKRNHQQSNHPFLTHTHTLSLVLARALAAFNFPAMIPLWMFPMSTVCGNTFVLKPSERVPLTAMRLAELALEAGMPKVRARHACNMHMHVACMCMGPCCRGWGVVAAA
eukprot:1406917-Prymnesium_polylepis.1